MPLSRNGVLGHSIEDDQKRQRYAFAEAELRRRTTFSEPQIRDVHRLTMGLRSPSALEQDFSFVQTETPARRGLMNAFVNTCQRWGLSKKQQLALLGFGDNVFFGLQILEGGYVHPPQDVRDRASYILGISVGLGAIFNESLEAELSWLTSSNVSLRNQVPLLFMLQGRMANIIAVSALVDRERGAV